MWTTAPIPSSPAAIAWLARRRLAPAWARSSWITTWASRRITRPAAVRARSRPNWSTRSVPAWPPLARNSVRLPAARVVAAGSTAPR
ncbi:hypothetical protein G6F51_014618 [Rhizopus arrhizus]|uniref:Uncharacterized protein n=1 Tax=Rhizopus oryzae TaxID=64495 RepID=A0A9P6XLU7_RHIOR|nr:hypothetical protein G6F51_014618 [Rhizopus arrhizus]